MYLYHSVQVIATPQRRKRRVAEAAAVAPTPRAAGETEQPTTTPATAPRRPPRTGTFKKNYLKVQIIFNNFVILNIYIYIIYMCYI